tara:strand:- start:1927 stop:5157 length:3231 start_codon:yes stop_codon:yes gene_type:complete
MDEVKKAMGETLAAATDAMGKAEIDPEKAAKKAAKIAEKEAKKAKAAAKAAAKAKAEEEKKKKEAEGGCEKKKKGKAASGPSEEDKLALESALKTPKGEKKDLVDTPMAKSYNPVAVEAAWYEWWEKCGMFTPEMGTNKPKFVIVIPPPNVTGALHIGHALTNSIQDTVVRWRRMSGYEALWVPGTDHAGIATQTVVEKKLAREEGVTRHDLGREKFLERVFEWKNEYGGKIFNQLRRIGSSMDWTREAFTMDEKLSKAVKEAFVRMFDEGLIYRDNRLVNWSCQLKTAISDIEVDYIELEGPTMLSVPGHTKKAEFGVITSFAYPFEDGEGEVVVATTRIETMLGDTAVAVHPDDERYKKLHGKFVVHPFNGRRIPIICDAELVDMEFGTGCVKITPAHDPNDFQTGKRHNLEFINVFTEDGLVNEQGGEQFQGMKRFECRVAITEALDKLGLYRGKANNPMRLGLCSRSKDVIEPMLKPQWWVNCQDMAKEACDAARDKRLEILPAFMEPTWFRWLENIRDWCISRQLWWGHRIPAFYVRFSGETDDDCGMPGGSSEKMDRWVIGRNAEEARVAAEKKFPGKEFTLEQDEDVLDTWFSSGLFPFSVFGWPDETPDLAEFYPTSLLETGHDILFFWVARMVMMGMKLTGKVPFKQVYLHAMVRDAHGRKMSKSLGNVIDPLHVIEGIDLEALHATLIGGNLDEKERKKAQAGQKADFPGGIPECGTDAMRFALVSYTAQGRDINLDVSRVVSYRHWCNKLWNAIKFAMMNLGEGYVPPSDINTSFDLKKLPHAAQWILSRLNEACGATNVAMEAYDFTVATSAVYAFWQYEVCDVFIEIIKPVMNGDDEVAKKGTRDALWICLDTGLRLLHPFMPFVTEELWQRLPRTRDENTPKSIMIADYPVKIDSWANAEVESQMQTIMDSVKALRSLKSNYNLPPKARPEVFYSAKTEESNVAMKIDPEGLTSLAGVGAMKQLAEGESAPPGCAVSIVNESVTVYILLKGVVDAATEIAKLDKKLAALRKTNETLQKKTQEDGYEDKVPEKVRNENTEKLAKQAEEIKSIETARADFEALL